MRNMISADRFAMQPRADIPRSAFDMRHTHKTTFDAGCLVPLYVTEVLPGDSIRHRMTAFCRLATPIVPVMDNLYLESFYFFVPSRLVWEHWEQFMGARTSPTDTTGYLLPRIEFDETELRPGDCGDYMGITVNPSGGGGPILVNALPFRAYTLIWNEWFRDQDLQAPQVVPTGDGPDAAIVGCYRRGKRADYFTTAKPWPQKLINTDLSGTLDPLQRGGSFAGVTGADTGSINRIGVPVMGIGYPAGSPGQGGAIANVYQTGGRVENWTNWLDGSDIAVESNTFNSPNIRVLISDIRIALAAQQFMERAARGGTRYTEILESQFGVRSPDARLQRPEYLGGGRSFINVNPVAQTSATGIAGTTTVLGELAGVGSGVAHDHGFSQSFLEHGYIIGLVTVRADLTYQNGVERMWWRRSTFDFYWPPFANLGEQAIRSKEIYCDGTAGDDAVFGYQERWAEYRQRYSRVSGFLRSSTGAPEGPIDMWHFAQDFASRPSLNSDFILELPPVSRVLQTDQLKGSEFLIDCQFDERFVRPLPMFSIPGVGARF